MGFKKELKEEPKIIINLQGDMPNIDPKAIFNLVSYMNKDKCDIGTLASDFNNRKEIDNPNVVKVAVKEKFSKDMFLNAVDFFRENKNSSYHLYHHIGIYAFTNEALLRSYLNNLDQYGEDGATKIAEEDIEQTLSNDPSLLCENIKESFSGL